MNKKIINLDLDGVFADFDRKFQEVGGFLYHTDPHRAWKIVEEFENFFLSLDPYQEAKMLFDEIYHRGIEAGHIVRILTALPKPTKNLITSASDKRTWVARHLSPEIQVICSNGAKEKKLFCKKGDALVDDKLENIEDWHHEGGHGIHHDSRDPSASIRELEYLKFF